MKYGLECKVTSNIFIEKMVNIVEGEKEFQLIPNDSGILSSIKIIKKLSNPEKFYSKIDDLGSVKHIQINEDTQVRLEIISDFQYLESCIGLIADLTKIFWNQPAVEWIPENDEERNRLKVFSAHFERAYSHEPTKMNINVFESLIKDKSKLDSLTILMSFYHEGKVYHNSFEYINAFYDFYFILEDLFGKRAYKNWQVKDNFKSSIELNDAINWALLNLIDSSIDHKRKIIELLDQKNLKYDVNGIIELLVGMRGNLHHFSRKNTISPSPLSQENYESLAFLSMGITMHSILNEIKKLKEGSAQITT